MSDKATLRPWGWQFFGDGWKLIGQHSQRPFVLGCWGVRKSPGPPPPAKFVLRDSATDRMVDFDPEHPDAALIVSAVNAYEAHQRAAEALRMLLDERSCAVGEACREAAFNHARAALAELDKVTR